MMGFQRLNHAALYVRDGERLREVGALTGASDHGRTKVLYARDPDGLEFEVSWLVPVDMLLLEPGGMKTMPLNLTNAIEKFGRQTCGGIGISH
jgi:catechol-2,3-dioxygenase